MSTKAVRKNQEETTTLQQIISDFLFKFRKIIIATLGAIGIILVVTMIFLAVSEQQNESAYENIDALVTQWLEAKTSQGETADLGTKELEIAAALEKIGLSRKNTYAGARANMSAAEIYFSRKDWENAGRLFRAAADAAPKLYTAGLNYFNAAVCAEESSNIELAVELLDKAIATRGFLFMTRALFNKARIEEQRGNKDIAIEAYDRLSADYPEDEWTLLARSRKIALEIN